jgi:hypothetical protein
MANEEAKTTSPDSRLEELQGVVEGFARLVGDFSQAIQGELELDQLEEQRQVAGVLAAGLQTQCEALGRLMLDHVGRADEEQLAQARTYLAASGVAGMIEQTRALMAPGTLQKKSLLSWIIFILEVIKEIFPILADLLHLPKKIVLLIQGILEIIDKILRMLTGFLGREAATNADQAQQIMWSSLERYWQATASFRSNPD